MKLIKRYRYPWSVIEKAVLLYKKNNLSYRSIQEEMRIKYDIDVSHKTIFEWVHKFSNKVKINNIKK